MADDQLRRLGFLKSIEANFMDFTLAGHGRLLSTFLENDYEVVSLEAVTSNKRHLIVRHDVDFSVEYAVKLAETEAALGIAAHYYFLVSGTFYNIFAASARTGISAIAGLGHHIGLHFDASLYEQDVTSLSQAAEREAMALNLATGVPVHSISFHRPAKALLGMDSKLAGYNHAYHPKVFKDIGYVSDSRGEWRYGKPDEQLAFSDRRALQLLTHPIWWYRETAELPIDRLRRFEAQQRAGLVEQMSLNSEPYSLARGTG